MTQASLLYSVQEYCSACWCAHACLFVCLNRYTAVGMKPSKRLATAPEKNGIAAAAAASNTGHSS